MGLRSLTPSHQTLKPLLGEVNTELLLEWRLSVASDQEGGESPVI